MTHSRLTVEERRRVIVRAIIQAAKEHGIYEFTHRDVAVRCDVETSTSTVQRYFTTRSSLRETAAAGDEALHKEYYK